MCDEHSPHLAEVLASVRNHVSSFVAADTTATDPAGSVDDPSGIADDSAPITPAERVLRGGLGDIPGRVHSCPGVKPADARNQILALVPDEATHILVLDDDLVLSCDGLLPDLIGSVPGDALVVPIEDHGFEHRRPLILRTGRTWTIADDARRSVRTERGVVTTLVDSVRLVRRLDGGRTWSALLADRDHLYRCIETTPSDPGVMFRLARTLADLGETSPALWWFSRCAEAAGASEETYCSWMFIGEQHLLAGRVDEAASAFMWAVQVRPARVEAYWHLAQIFNADRDYAKARMWAESGMMQRPARDTLFVQPWIARWGLQFQWATAAWWTGDALAARSMLESLIDSGLLVEPWTSLARRNAERVPPGQEPLRFG